MHDRSLEDATHAPYGHVKCWDFPPGCNTIRACAAANQCAKAHPKHVIGMSRQESERLTGAPTVPSIEEREADFDRVTGQFICQVVPGETVADTVRNITVELDRILGHHLKPDFGKHIRIMVNPPVDVDETTATHDVTFVIAAKDAEGECLIQSLHAASRHMATPGEMAALTRQNSAGAMWYAMSNKQRAVVATLNPNNLWSYRGTYLSVMEPDGRVRQFDNHGREQPNVWIPRREYPPAIEAGAPGA